MTKIDVAALGLPEHAIVRHFNTADEKDYFSEPVRDVPTWNETGFFEAYNPDESVGVFTHVGRCQQDLDLWWSHSIIFLPDGRYLADRSYGRSKDGLSAGGGSSHIYILEPFRKWRSVFDGHGAWTTTAGLAAGVRGHGSGVAVRYDVTGEALDPVWDLSADNDGHAPAGNWAGDGHYQQNFRTTGTLNVAGTQYSLNGVGWNDHSRGPRTFDDFGTHRWLSAILPGISIHAITVWDVSGNLKTAVGSMFTENGREPVSVNFPGLANVVGAPDAYEIVVTRKNGGDPIRLQAVTKHMQMLTIDGTMENMNGVCWEADDAATCHWDSIVELTMADGRKGLAHTERSMRLTELKTRFPRG